MTENELSTVKETTKSLASFVYGFFPTGSVSSSQDSQGDICFEIVVNLSGDGSGFRYRVSLSLQDLWADAPFVRAKLIYYQFLRSVKQNQQNQTGLFLGRLLDNENTDY